MAAELRCFQERVQRTELLLKYDPATVLELEEHPPADWEGDAHGPETSF
jgi:hypothetical protein